MKLLFTGLGSIASKHIKDVISILNEKNIKYEITILRREKKDLPNDFLSYNIRQITTLGNEHFDVAFITNPTTMHYVTLKELTGKVDFYFIEKPIFETTYYDIESLGISEKNTYIAAPMRHSGIYKYLQKIVTSEKIFSSRIICSSYLPEWRPNIDYRKNYSAIKNLGGGVQLDLIHEIDYMAGLFGFPQKIFSFSGKYSNLEIDSNDLSVYIANYGDKLCEVHLDYFGREYRRTCELFTETGTYMADFKTESIKIPDGSVISCAITTKSNLRLEMEYFFEFILGKVENINSPGYALKVLGMALEEI